MYSLKAPRVYAHENLPSFVPWETVQDILQSKKDAAGTGVRDYAILLLLTVYGLRCSEVTNMKLKDIDWRNETLYLRRAKNCRPQVLPLLPIVGDAIIRYIKEARFNKSGNEYLFLCRRAPHEQLSTSTIYKLVRDELKGKGLVAPLRAAQPASYLCHTPYQHRAFLERNRRFAGAHRA